MPLTAYKTWIDGEVVTAADLNASFDQVFNNQQSIGTPRTAAIDMDGQELILDGDADSSITADTDDRIDFKMQGQDLVKFDGTTASAVNGLTVLASATGSAVQLKAHGSDTNIGMTMVPKGSGQFGVTATTILLDAVTSVDIDGSALILDADGDSSLRETSDDVLAMKLQNVDTFIFDGDVASSAHGLTFTSAASGGDVTVATSGAGLNINLAVTAKGSGTLKLSSGSGSVTINGGTVTATPAANAVVVANASGNLANGWLSAGSVDQHADFTLLSTASPSGAGSVDFDNTVITASYFMYLITYQLIFSTDDTELNVRTDTSNGASVDAGAGNYSWVLSYVNTAGASSTSDASATLISMFDTGSGTGVGNAANEGANGHVWITSRGSASLFPSVEFAADYLDASTRTTSVRGAGHRRASTAAIDFVRLLPTGGTITGEVRIYGVKPA